MHSLVCSRLLILSESAENFANFEAGNHFHFCSGTHLLEHRAGCVSPQPGSSSVRMQKAFRDDFTAAGHDGVDDGGGRAAQTVNM